MSEHSSLVPLPMKDSGVEWIGEIPEGWELARLKNIATVRVSNVDKKSVETEIPVLLCNYTDVYYQDRISAGTDFMRATASVGQIRQFGIQMGDVLVTKDSETAEDIGVSSLVADELENVVLGYHLAILRAQPNRMRAEYLGWQIQALFVKEQMCIAATGVTRFGLRQESIAELAVLLPPLPEQQAIAAYLDKETAKIDDLVAKKQRLIELLDERRASLISHAVTKGLNLEAPMKDSGVEWIGEIPEGWKVSALKRACTLSANYGLNATRNEYSVSGVRLIRTSDITESGLLKDETDAVYLDPHETVGMLLNPGDLLFSRSGTLGRCLRFPEVDTPHTFAAYLVRFVVSQLNSSRFIEACAQTAFFLAQIHSAAVQSTISNFNGEKYGEIILPLPPLPEQQAIAAYLDIETAKIDKLKELTKQQIGLLGEKRQSLITEAVTGKIQEAREVA